MTRHFSKFFLLSIGLLLLACQKPTDIDSYLKKLHEAGKLNGNVLVLQSGEILYEQSFGYADGTKTTELSSDYRFNIGSIYKEFPAISIMQLHKKGLLDTKDTIATYLTDLPNWASKITIQQLLQYSSGLPKINWNAYFSAGITLTDSLLWADLHKITTLEFEPGSDYLYTNLSPILLIHIVEEISATSFTTYLQTNIFKAAGMENTIIKSAYPYVDKTLMAIPINADFDEDAYTLAVSSVLFNSTASDMARLFEHIEDFKLIEKESVQFLSKTAQNNKNNQAPLGTCIWKNEKLIEHRHHGSTANFECIIRSFKQEGITIAILTNQKHGNVHDISDVIYELLR